MERSRRRRSPNMNSRLSTRSSLFEHKDCSLLDGGWDSVPRRDMVDMVVNFCCVTC